MVVRVSAPVGEMIDTYTQSLPQLPGHLHRLSGHMMNYIFHDHYKRCQCVVFHYTRYMLSLHGHLSDKTFWR